MAAGNTTEIDLSSTSSNGATFLISNQYSQDSGYVVVFTDSTLSHEVARSERVTVYQSSSMATVSGLESGTVYWADFYSETWESYTMFGIAFLTDTITIPPAQTYGSVNALSTRFGQLYIPIQQDITDEYNSAYATKLYCSVNGRSKLCFVGKGHRPVKPLGSIVYYTDYSLTTTATVNMYTRSELDQFCSGMSEPFITIEGVTIDTMMVKEIHLGKQVTGTFGDYFLFGYMSIDTIDIGESRITSLGDYAMSGCYELRDTDIALPQTLTHIGSFFMNMCANFEGVLDVGDLPANIITTDTQTFATSGPNMPAYTNGFKIRGSTKWDWIDRFPNSFANPYRNLQPADIDYGVVYYKANSTSATIQRVELQNASELSSLAGSAAWTKTVGADQITVSAQGDNCVIGIRVGDKITTLPSYFMSRTSYLSMPMYVPKNVTSLGGYFLYYSGISNQAVKIDANITSVGSSFMRYCSAFNLYVTLPGTLTTIGTYFMANCTVYNQSLTLPSSLTSVGSYFLYMCNAMTSVVSVGSLAATIATSSNYSFATTSATAVMYTTGVRIAGSTRADWISRFPNRTSSPYRKLVNAGY